MIEEGHHDVGSFLETECRGRQRVHGTGCDGKGGYIVLSTVVTVYEGEAGTGIEDNVGCMIIKMKVG